MRRVFVGVIALSVLAVVALGVSRTAPAQPKVTEVLIGSVLPLTGNFASLGQQYLWASQTVEDIVNNDYADIQVPLGPGKGFPGLGGAPIKFIVRDDQSRGEQARTIVEQLISVNKVHWINAEGTSGITSILQPVVENAIKFGLYDTIEAVTICINASVSDHTLIITVQNPFDATTSIPRQGTGFGLSSVQRRLYLLFARNDLLETSNSENVFITTIKIPQSHDKSDIN